MLRQPTLTAAPGGDPSSPQKLFLSAPVGPRPLGENQRWPLTSEKPQPEGHNAGVGGCGHRCWPGNQASVTCLQAGVTPPPLQPPRCAQHLPLHPQAGEPCPARPQMAQPQGCFEGPLTTGRSWVPRPSSQSPQTAGPPAAS